MSPVSLSPGDEVPHMFTRKPHLRLEKFAITCTKRLLQQSLPTAVSCIAANHVHGCKFTRTPLRAAESRSVLSHRVLWRLATECGPRRADPQFPYTCQYRSFLM